MRDGDEEHSLGKAEVLYAREKALHVKLENDIRWVPRSVVHEDSELEADAAKGETGELFVKVWWAEKEGL